MEQKKFTDAEISAILNKNSPYTFADLCDIMALLRSPGGCPWDREQTHKSIRGNLIEETYEVIEAIDTNDAVLLREELGDVLLQVVFHAQIAHEVWRFNIGEVTDGICRKLISRHPHIFGDVKADTTETVLENWNKIKATEKRRDTPADRASAVPLSLPALMRAIKVIKAAGVDSCRNGKGNDILAKYNKSCAEFNRILNEYDNIPTDATGEPQTNQPNNRVNFTDVTSAMGDMLFAASALAREKGIDAELALTQAIDKFIEGL